MSAYKEIVTEFRNLESLKKALADVDLGHFDVTVNPKANDLALTGYGGSQGEKVALRIPKSHYGGYEDTGFAWDTATQTYRAIISTGGGGVLHYEIIFCII